MEKTDKESLVEIVFGIILGVVLNAYLIFDVSYYGILNKHSPLDFIWNLSMYTGQPLLLLLVFIIIQMGLTTIYCLFLSSYFVSRGRIIPPSLVLFGSVVPLILIVESFFFQLFERQYVQNPLFAAYMITFLLTLLYSVWVFLAGSNLDRIVRTILGGYIEEAQIEENVQAYSSNLEFENLVEMLEDRKWLIQYASLETIQHKDGKEEASFRLNKIRTNHYLCVSIFQRDKQNLVLLTFYELYENRFGRQLRVPEETERVLDSQIKLIKERLNLSEAKAGVGILRKAVRFTTQVARVPVQRIAPYRMHVSVLVLNIIALGALSYLNSIGIIEGSIAIAVYTLIFMVSLEAVRLRTREK